MDQQRATNSVLQDMLTMVFTHARGMWRFRWLAMGLAWLICGVGWFFVYSMPDVYEADARVYVDTDSVVRKLLQNIAVSNDVMSEVNVVTREMLSRPNVAEVARATDLDLKVETPQQFENLVTSLQRQISVAGSRDQVFTISFQHPERAKAERVVQSLVDTFVERSLGADRTDSVRAQSFLERQIAEYEQRLTDAEDKLAQFKRDNLQFMPDQRGDYFGKLQSAQAALGDTRQRLRVAEERKEELQRQIEGEEPVFGIMPSTVGGGGESGGSGFASSRIRQLESELEVLRLQYTDKHPRIGQILATIEMLKEQQAAERAEQPDRPAQPSSTNPLDLNPVYQNMRIQLSNIEVEIAELRAEERQQAAEVATLRRQVDTIPQVEAELNRLNRDYDIVKGKYEQLVQQLETANIGDSMAQSIDEVQFRIIEPPYADANPAGPNRPLFLSAVLVFALGAGGALAFLLNQLKPVFIGKRSVTEVTGLPVLTSVSLLQTNAQMAAARRNTQLLMGGALVLGDSARSDYRFRRPGIGTPARPAIESMTE
ncbi:MAG: XrtA system polysaccharide chain length determinant [Woeseiaceae bacterium]|nr:XrtA system polysaccharide chain length determinant [Woeseiaceae bacterium]